MANKKILIKYMSKNKEGEIEPSEIEIEFLGLQDLDEKLSKSEYKIGRMDKDLISKGVKQYFIDNFDGRNPNEVNNSVNLIYERMRVSVIKEGKKESGLSHLLNHEVMQDIKALLDVFYKHGREMGFNNNLINLFQGLELANDEIRKKIESDKLSSVAIVKRMNESRETFNKIYFDPEFGEFIKNKMMEYKLFNKSDFK